MLTFGAYSIYVQREPVFLETVQVSTLNGFDNFRRLYFIDITAYGAYLVDVILVLVATFVFRLPNESVPYNEAQAYEQLHGVVKCCTGDTEVARFKQFTKFLKRKMPVHAVYGIEDGITLGGLAMSVMLEVIVEHSAYSFLNGVVGHFCH